MSRNKLHTLCLAADSLASGRDERALWDWVDRDATRRDQSDCRTYVHFPLWWSVSHWCNEQWNVSAPILSNDFAVMRQFSKAASILPLGVKSSGRRWLSMAIRRSVTDLITDMYVQIKPRMRFLWFSSRSGLIAVLALPASQRIFWTPVYIYVSSSKWQSSDWGRVSYIIATPSTLGCMAA